jgi:hypothetical protein
MFDMERLVEDCAKRERDFQPPFDWRILKNVGADICREVILTILSKEEWDRPELDSVRERIVRDRLSFLAEGFDVGQVEKEVHRWLTAVAKEVQQRYIVAVPHPQRPDVSNYRLEFLDRIIKRIERRAVSVESASSEVKKELEDSLEGKSAGGDLGSWILGRELTKEVIKKVLDEGCKTARADYKWVGSRESGSKVSILSWHGWSS